MKDNSEKRIIFFFIINIRYSSSQKIINKDHVYLDYPCMKDLFIFFDIRPLFCGFREL